MIKQQINIKLIIVCYYHLQGQFVMDGFLMETSDIVATAGTVADRETILRQNLFVPLLDVVTQYWFNTDSIRT